METDLKQEDIDDCSEHGRDSNGNHEAETDFDLNVEKAEPILLIPFLKTEETEEANKKRNKKNILNRQERKRRDSERDQHYSEDIRDDPDWVLTDQTRKQEEKEEEENGGENEEDREKIVKNREKLPCPFCEEQFSSSRLAKHLKFSHPKERDSEVYKQTMADNTLPGFVCSICGMQFENERWLHEHNATSHNIHINSGGVACGVCGKLLKTLRTLQSHMQNVHEKNTEVLCGECGKICSNKAALNYHIQSLHSSIEFPCMECGKLFRSKRLMRMHFNRVHSGRERQHKCQICSKAFLLPNDLKKHISQVHDKLKPFYCEACPFQTTTMTNLNFHRKKAHERPTISRIALIEMVETGQHQFYTLNDIPMIRSGPH